MTKQLPEEFYAIFKGGGKLEIMECEVDNGKVFAKSVRFMHKRFTKMQQILPTADWSQHASYYFKNAKADDEKVLMFPFSTFAEDDALDNTEHSLKNINTQLQSKIDMLENTVADLRNTADNISHTDKFDKQFIKELDKSATIKKKTATGMSWNTGGVQ